MEATKEPSKEPDTVPERGGRGGGGPEAKYGNEPNVKQIAIWRTGCKSKFPEPMYRTQCFHIFDQFITICTFLKGGGVMKLGF